MDSDGLRPERALIDPNRGHKPGGNSNKWDKHSEPRAGDKGNQGLGKDGYPPNPPSQRQQQRDAAKEAARKAKEVADGLSNASGAIWDIVVQNWPQAVQLVIDASASCGGSCFTGKTTVIMADGSPKPIDAICDGDSVLSLDLDTNKVQASIVSARLVSISSDLVDIVTPDGTVLTTTYGHPFLTEGKAFEPAGTLSTANHLVSSSGASLSLCKISNRHSATRVNVYNLKVDGTHTFFVGQLGVCVHDMTRIEARSLKSPLTVNR